MRPMRLIVLLAVLALMATPVLAQQSDQGSMGGGMNAQDPGAGGAMNKMHAEGDVSNIDQQNKTLQLSEAGQAPKTLHFSSNTQVIDQNGQMGSIGSLKDGDRIRANYKKSDGKNEATKLQIMAPAGQGGGMMQQPSGGMKGGAGGGAMQGGSSSGY